VPIHRNHPLICLAAVACVPLTYAVLAHCDIPWGPLDVETPAVWCGASVGTLRLVLSGLGLLVPEIVIAVSGPVLRPVLRAIPFARIGRFVWNVETMAGKVDEMHAVICPREPRA
jgi:hypothetical protein